MKKGALRNSPWGFPGSLSPTQILEDEDSFDLLNHYQDGDLNGLNGVRQAEIREIEEGEDLEDFQGFIAEDSQVAEARSAEIKQALLKESFGEEVKNINAKEEDFHGLENGNTERQWRPEAWSLNSQ